MASSDPHQGGDLNDMAVKGTKVPNDAGEMNVIPSVPRPDQKDLSATAGGLGADDLASAADNATDIPRRNKDMGATGEVITGVGDQMPAQAESKRLHYGANDPQSKGHDRYDKHTKQNESDIEKYAGEGAEVQPVPGEEGDSQDAMRDRKTA